MYRHRRFILRSVSLVLTMALLSSAPAAALDAAQEAEAVQEEAASISAQMNHNLEAFFDNPVFEVESSEIRLASELNELILSSDVQTQQIVNSAETMDVYDVNINEMQELFPEINSYIDVSVYKGVTNILYDTTSGMRTSMAWQGDVLLNKATYDPVNKILYFYDSETDTLTAEFFDPIISTEASFPEEQWDKIERILESEEPDAYAKVNELSGLLARDLEESIPWIHGDAGISVMAVGSRLNPNSNIKKLVHKS